MHGRDSTKNSETKKKKEKKKKKRKNNNKHCAKSVLIWNFSGPYIPEFGLNTGRYGVFSPNAGKYGAEKHRIRTLFTQ